MKTRLIILLTALPLLSYSQSITFKVEDLSKPEKSLWKTAPDQIYRKLILSDVNLYDIEIKRICKLLPNTKLIINNKSYNIR